MGLNKSYLIFKPYQWSYRLLFYFWYKDEYENTICIELTEEEKKKINKKLIDEVEIE